MASEIDLLETLQVPERHPRELSQVDPRPRRLAAWVGDLPLANVGESARQVYHTLSELNQTELDPHDRFKDLELLREPVRHLVDSVKRRYLKEAFPLGQRQQKAAELARTFPGKMAQGYKEVLVDGLANDGRLDHKTLARCLHRALRYLSETLLRSYESYARCPPGFWREIHAIYAYAEAAKIERTEVKDPLLHNAHAQSILDAYKQIVLLGLVSPYRLYQGEVERVYLALETWAPSAVIGPFDRERSGFVIALDEDAPALYRELAQVDDHEQSRSLDTEGLTSQIRREITKAQRESTTPVAMRTEGLDADLLRRLMLVWGIAPKRRFPRTRKHSSVLTAVGLTASYHFVEAHSPDHTQEEGAHGTGTDGSGPITSRPAQFTSTVAQGTYGRVPDVWDLAYQPADDSDPATVTLNTASGHPERTYTVQVLRMVNASAGGQCLLWDRQDSCHARVGELLCVRDVDNDDPTQSGVGVLRWLRFTKGRGLELGVQLLAPTAHAIAVYPLDTNRRPKDYLRGLLLPELQAIRQSATVVLPAIPFSVGQRILINQHGRERLVRLARLVENTGAFAQFQFDPVDSERSEDKDNEAQAEDTEFEAIWSAL